MKKLVFLAALAALTLPMLARAQTAQLINSFTATASGSFADSAVPPQVDSLNVRINGIGTTASWSAQIQTSPDNTTWTNCGSAVTATSGASASGGSCTPSGAVYAHVVVTAGSGGGTLSGVLVGNSSLITFNNGGGGGATFPGTAGVVCNTSTTASKNCASSDIQSVLGAVYLPLFGGTLTGPVTLQTPAGTDADLVFNPQGSGTASYTIRDTSSTNTPGYLTIVRNSLGVTDFAYGPLTTFTSQAAYSNAVVLGFTGSTDARTGLIAGLSLGGAATLDLGNGGYADTSGTLNLATVNAGTSVVSPDLKLTSLAQPTCSATTAGQFNYVQGNATTKDTVSVCAHDASDVYAWRTIY